MVVKARVRAVGRRPASREGWREALLRGQRPATLRALAAAAAAAAEAAGRPQPVSVRGMLRVPCRTLWICHYGCKVTV